MKYGSQFDFPAVSLYSDSAECKKRNLYLFRILYSVLEIM